MKSNITIFMFLVIILLLNGCAGNPKTATSPTQEITQPTAMEESYPGPDTTLNTYPEPQNNSPSQQPTNKLPLVPSATPNPQKDIVVITNVTHDETGLETIEITNISDQPQDINGYTLLIPSTNEHINIFNIVLDPGKSYSVFNGPGAREQSNGIGWLDSPVLQQSGDEIILLNRPGRVVWTYIYYP